MLTEQQCARFEELFRGRWDVYGRADDRPCVMHRPVDRALYRNHISDPEHPIGIFPLLDNGTVCWGCTDLDTGELALGQAFTLQRVLQHLGITSWVEISRSKGAHLWVFAEHSVPAQTMRNALLAAHQIADIRATEVNPKQTAVTADKPYGNWVRLPYPAGRTPGRQTMTDVHDTIDIGSWVDIAWNSRVPMSVLERAAKLYTAPEPKVATVDTTGSTDIEQARKKLSGLAHTIYVNGPLKARDGKPGRDRSSTLSRLAWLIGTEGQLSPSEAFTILKDADSRWGKFHERPDGDQQLRRILEWAWNQ